MTTDWTIALAGDADADERNIHKLLDDFLPTDSEVTAWLPEKLGRSQKGLRKTLAWLEEQEIIPQRWEAGQDPVDHLVAAREADNDVYLVLLWGDEGDDRARELFEKAHAAGIPVKDLSGALDDLRYEEDEAPPAQLQAEPEKPARRRRGPGSTSTAAEPAEASTEPDEAQALIPPQMTTPVQAVVTGLTDEEADRQAELAISFKEGMAAASLESVIRRIIRKLLSEELETYLNAPAETAVATVKPGEPTSDYLMSADGHYRVKTTRTRTKKDETEVKLTTAEADQLREAGLLA